MIHVFAEWCLQAREDRRLSPRRRRWLDGHLEGCARCRAAGERAKAVRETLEEVRRSRAPELDWDRIERSIRREARAAAPARAPFPRTLALAGAAALVAILFFAIRSERPTLPARTGSEAFAVRTEREPVKALVTLVQGSVFVRRPFDSGERRAVARMRLGEGSRIVTASRAAVVVQTAPNTGFRLDERSRVEIDRLREGELEVDLRLGGVGSNVAPLGDGDRFVLKVDSLELHVRGTRFSVHRDREQVAVEVLEGVVEVVRYEESISLRAPARAVFETGVPLADATHARPTAPAGALRSETLNLRGSWPDTLASLRGPGKRGSGGEVRVDGIAMGTTPLLVLREPGPATVQIIKAGEVTRFEIDVDGYDVEPGDPVEAELDTPAPPNVGRLERSAVVRVIRSHTADVQRCYERRLKRVPTAGGSVEMRFTIAADGSVSRARARRSETDAEIVRCLERAVMSWTFDRPEGGAVHVVYPLTFASTGGR